MIFNKALSAPEIAEAAGTLQDAVESEADPQVIVGLTVELMDLCRATQSAFLSGIDYREQHEQAQAVNGSPA